ncbi:MAG: hypothetical protein PVJ65_08550, partial [Chromatiales bacterium]
MSLTLPAGQNTHGDSDTIRVFAVDFDKRPFFFVQALHWACNQCGGPVTRQKKTPPKRGSRWKHSPSDGVHFSYLAAGAAGAGIWGA